MLKKGRPPSPTHIISFVIFCFIHPSKDNKTNSCIPNFIEGDSKASCQQQLKIAKEVGRNLDFVQYLLRMA
ncbi:unnamed protein product [Sphagnum jensenii]